MRVALLAIVVVALASTAAVSGSLLPEGTATSSLVVRALAGLAIGLVLVMVVRRMLGALVAPPPPPAERVDARPADVVYECPVCGTRVRLEVAVTAKAPKHCGEEMETLLGGG